MNNLKRYPDIIKNVILDTDFYCNKLVLALNNKDAYEKVSDKADRKVFRDDIFVTP